ncbi:hypothetical protein PVL29_025394 [Vitis rotundifolia]|uniref:Uncharacterized protein n=1 Tax=Vitis rotundifolia TaxID=103349 RepID=A0AA39D5P3_VITRO|nr:hypothetical protein PVL29_025394 [Vitis rotundifolia]
MNTSTSMQHSSLCSLRLISMQASWKIENTSFKVLELLRERERYKEEQVEKLKHSMQSGMDSFRFNIPPGSSYNYILLLALEAWLNGKGLEWAQAMKEQARHREEMAYQYKVGNFEAAAAIQRRLDPDVAM